MLIQIMAITSLAVNVRGRQFLNSEQRRFITKNVFKTIHGNLPPQILECLLKQAQIHYTIRLSTLIQMQLNDKVFFILGIIPWRAARKVEWIRRSR